MKIGFYSCMTGMPWGGSESLWSRVAHQLLERGDKVTVNFRWWQSEATELKMLRDAGASIWFREEPYRPNWTTRLVNRLRQSSNDAADPRTRIQKWLGTEKPDFVLVTVGYHPDRIAPADECIRRGIPYAINVQCASTNTFISDSFVDDFRRAYQNAAKVFFVSQENRDKVETNLAMTLDNAEIIDNPFNVSFHANPDWPEAAEHFDLACVGRLHFMSKGQDLLVHALKHPKWRDRKMRIFLYGKSQGNRHQMRDLIRQFDLTEKIKFREYASEMETLWANHQGLILPSRYEGAPLVVVEAMLCNRICIATDVGRNKELIDDGETGFIARAPTVEFLDDALERAWQRRDEWRRMGLLAGQRIRQRYGQDPVSDFRDRLISLLPQAATSGVTSFSSGGSS